MNKMIETRLLTCAHDARAQVGVVIFKHTFQDGTRYSVQSCPVNSERAELMTEQVFNTDTEAIEAFDELLRLLELQVGPLTVQDVPPEITGPLTSQTMEQNLCQAH